MESLTSIIQTVVYIILSIMIILSVAYFYTMKKRTEKDENTESLTEEDTKFAVNNKIKDRNDIS